MNRKASKGIGVYIVILAMLMMTIYFAVSMMSDQEQPKYYEIISYFEEEQVQEFTLDVSSGEMSMADPKRRGADGDHQLPGSQRQYVL